MARTARGGDSFTRVFRTTLRGIVGNVRKDGEHWTDARTDGSWFAQGRRKHTGKGRRHGC